MAHSEKVADPASNATNVAEAVPSARGFKAMAGVFTRGLGIISMARVIPWSVSRC